MGSSEITEIPTVKVFAHDARGNLITPKPLKFVVVGNDRIEYAKLQDVLGPLLLYEAPDGVVIGADAQGLCNVPFPAGGEIHVYMFVPPSIPGPGPSFSLLELCGAVRSLCMQLAGHLAAPRAKNEK